eukprot:7232283-Lingulodinium_polyedra.AAC.1
MAGAYTFLASRRELLLRQLRAGRETLRGAPRRLSRVPASRRRSQTSRGPQQDLAALRRSTGLPTGKRPSAGPPK